MHKRHYESFQDFNQLIENRKQMQEKAKKQCHYKKNIFDIIMKQLNFTLYASLN